MADTAVQDNHAHALVGAIPPGGATRYYQTFYRNAAVFCTPATSNRTNGAAIVWAP